MANIVANVTIGALESVTIASTIFGYTGKPFTTSVELVLTDFFAEQSKTAIISEPTQRNVISTCELIENTSTNIAILWSLAEASLVSSGGNFTLSIDQSDRGNVTLVAVGSAGTAPKIGTVKKVRTFNFPNTRIEGAVETQMAKEDITRLAATFKHLADSNGLVGTMVDTL